YFCFFLHCVGGPPPTPVPSRLWPLGLATGDLPLGVAAVGRRRSSRLPPSPRITRMRRTHCEHDLAHAPKGRRGSAYRPDGPRRRASLRRGRAASLSDLPTRRRLSAVRPTSDPPLRRRRDAR